MSSPSNLANPVDASDVRLVEAARLGNRKAFVEIVHRYQNLVTGVTLAILRDFSLSEDAAQEAFIHAWQKINTLKNGDKLRPWICQIARNTALNHSKKRRPADPLAPSLIDPSPRPDELAISRDEQSTLLSALDSLPEKYRLPLVLYYREDQSIKTVAKTLSQNEATIRKQLSRGRDLLKKEMADLFKNTLPRTAPGPVFTATVAGLIGAMLKPTAVAATAFSADPLATTATAMTTSKLTITTAALITAVCLPVGYTARAIIPNEASKAPAQLNITPERSKRETFDPSLSPIAMEWQKLLASCQNDPKAFPDLYRTIAEIPGNLRREAFHSLLLAEWVRLDPANGLTFVRSLDHSQWQQELFAKEWIKTDINSAIDGLMKGGPGWDFLKQTHLADVKDGEAWIVILGRNLDEVVAKAPERFAEIIQAFPTSRYLNIIAPIEKFFRADPQAARQLADSLTGHRRNLVWIGIAHARSKENFEDALRWARATKDPAHRATLIKAVISSEGWRNPLNAVGFLDTVSPGIGESIGSSIIHSLAEKDFPEALKWASRNPTSSFLSGLTTQLYDRLRREPTTLVHDLNKAGALQSTADTLGLMSLLSQPTETQALVWNKLLELGPSPGAEALREAIVSRIPKKDPLQIMTLIDQLPDGPEQEKFTGMVVQKITKLAEPELGKKDDPFEDGGDHEALAEILEQAPQEWRDRLNEEGAKTK